MQKLKFVTCQNMLKVEKFSYLYLTNKFKLPDMGFVEKFKS